MDQHPDCPFGSPEDPGDLGRRHLLDESEDDRSPPIGRQAPDGPPRGSRLLPDGCAALDVEWIRDGGSGLDRRLRVAATAATLVRDDVAGDPEKPDAERRSAFAVGRAGPLLEPIEMGQRSEERPLGGVLGLVVIAELVVRVAVHLGQIPAIERIEASWIVAGRINERAIAVEMSDGGTGPNLRCRSHSSKHRSSHGVTPPRRDGGVEFRR